MDICRLWKRDWTGVHRERSAEFIGSCKNTSGYRKSSFHLDGCIIRKDIGRKARLQGFVSLCYEAIYCLKIALKRPLSS